jgi:hypothetical protein
MTVKEAILKSLEEIDKETNYMEVCNHIIEHNYYDFKNNRTPSATVAALLGIFIKNGDKRIKRIKKGIGYLYYLTKNESKIESNLLEVEVKKNSNIKSKVKSYDERDLHKLLTSYLKTTDEYSKTIFHEQSNRTDEHQKWIHPDMVGIRFLKLRNPVSQGFLKTINRIETFKLTSYEIKKEINSDYELKKSFFQAVSNSSWANYGYLVAFEIDDRLNDEMERLNQSFGIGIIELKSNPYESKIVYPARLKNLDFKTIDKLCKINKDFEQFIVQTEKLMTADEKYLKSTEKELDEFCDNYFINDSEVDLYCIEKNIPMEKIEEQILN